jgi:polar amino acid transport system substrate-binding protein
MTPREAVAELAPTGVLRAAINMGNFLLVSGKSASGDPEGVAPDMAREVASRLGVPVRYVPFARPNALADAADDGVWDVGLIGAEPQRAAKIAFAPPYVEIEATYLVPAGSSISAIADVDRPGVRIAVLEGAAYDLWLARNIRHAEVLRAESAGAAAKLVADREADALAGLRPGLIGDLERQPGARVLEGRFTAVQQSIGTQKRNVNGAAFLADFVRDAKASGLVERLIARYGMGGRLIVAA